MKKSIQMLTAILVASLVLSNAVTAEINPATTANTGEDLANILKEVQYQPTNTKVYYESIIKSDDEKQAVDELTEAYGKFEADVTKVSEYSQALCQAKKELILIDNNIKMAKVYTQLCNHFVRLLPEGLLSDIIPLPTNAEGEELDIDHMNFLTLKELEELRELEKELNYWGEPYANFPQYEQISHDFFGNEVKLWEDNTTLKELSDKYNGGATIHNKEYILDENNSPRTFVDANGQTHFMIKSFRCNMHGMASLMMLKIEKVLNKHPFKDGYIPGPYEPEWDTSKINPEYAKIMEKQPILHFLYQYSDIHKEGEYDTPYERTLAKLRRKAAKTSARIKIIEEFGKRMHITFNPCEFEDPFKTTKDSETTKTTEKKDSVPNTAAFNFFPQLPTTCSYAIVSEGEGCCKVFKVVKACELAKGAKTVAFTYNELADYSIKALACSCK